MKKSGRFITFEGIEGSGKSTIIELVANRLRDLDEFPIVTREPGGSSLGRLLRPILLNTSTSLDSLAELYLFLADRAQHMEEEILPALASCKTILCDRFADSTIAYQAYGRGLDIEKTRKLALTHNREPDLTLLLDLDPETALERARQRNRKNGMEFSEGRFDMESMAFHARVREGFLEQARLFPDRIAIVDASLPIAQVLERCLARIAKKFDNMAGWQT